MVFQDFIGNDKIKEQLSFMQHSHRLPHAIVIEGDEGMGKRTLAREIALNLLCRESGDAPCRKCPQCIKVMQGYHPDVYEYSVPPTKVFKVDEVRKIRDDIIVRPNEADYKIYILGNCQCMNENAQNAILKILEEPPQYVMFILTTTTKSALLETVLSRSVTLSLERIDNDSAAQYITSHYDDISYEDAYNASVVWNGNIGKAIESLNDGKLSQISDTAKRICDTLINSSEYELLKICYEFFGDSDYAMAVIGLLKIIFRDALLYGSGDIMSGQNESDKLLAARLNKVKLMDMIKLCDELELFIRQNGDNAVLITKICYALRRAIGR